MTDLPLRGYDEEASAGVKEGLRGAGGLWCGAERGRKPPACARARPYWSLSQRIVPSVTEKSSEPGCNWPFASP